MKKVFVITWDNEYEGLLESYKAYSGDKKMFSIDELTENQFTFYMWAENKGIEIRK